MPVLLAWPVGGLLAAGVAWVIGKTALGLRSDYLAIATLAGKLVAEMVAGQAGRFDLMAEGPTQRFPGGAALRTPLLVAAMLWFSLRDRL